jgi:hypothetical protein
MPTQPFNKYKKQKNSIYPQQFILFRDYRKTYDLNNDIIWNIMKHTLTKAIKLFYKNRNINKIYKHRTYCYEQRLKTWNVFYHLYCCIKTAIKS